MQSFAIICDIPICIVVLFTKKSKDRFSGLMQVLILSRVQEVHSEAFLQPMTLAVKWLMGLLVPNKRIVSEIPTDLQSNSLMSRPKTSAKLLKLLNLFQSSWPNHVSRGGESSSIHHRAIKHADKTSGGKRITKPRSFQSKTEYLQYSRRCNTTKKKDSLLSYSHLFLAMFAYI